MTSALFPITVASGRTVTREEGGVMGLEHLFGWFQNNMAACVAVISAIVALVAAAISRHETRKQRVLQQQNMRNNLDAQSVGWGNACIDTLNRAAMFARTRQHQANDAGFLQQRVNMMLSISSLIERGRLFFPDIDLQAKSAADATVFGHARPPILQALSLAYHEVDALTRQGGPTADNSAEFIDGCRRLLVSELQAHLHDQRQSTLADRYDDQTEGRRVDAINRAETLKTLLKSRRPGINLSDRQETVQ